MSQYRHHVSGIFLNRTETESTLNTLIENGIPNEQIQIFDSNTSLPAATEQAKSNEVLKDMAVDGVIGTAVGTGIGALTQVALIAEIVSLFIASPLIAPLALLGWGASLGAMAGATFGAKNGSKKEGKNNKYSCSSNCHYQRSIKNEEGYAKCSNGNEYDTKYNPTKINILFNSFGFNSST